jgi:hypothetical protein
MEMNEQWDEITASIVSIRKNDKRKRRSGKANGRPSWIHLTGYGILILAGIKWAEKARLMHVQSPCFKSNKSHSQSTIVHSLIFFLLEVNGLDIVSNELI